MTRLPKLQRSFQMDWLLEAFVAINLAFLGADIYIAHLANEFAHGVEWVPIFFSAVATLWLLPGLVTKELRAGLPRTAGWIVGIASIVIGVSGLFFHLESSFFAAPSLKNLVYAAPFVAPLAYAGVGLLVILNRMEDSELPSWGHWVVFFALGGFVGNFVLSVVDHAQNGFYKSSEWIPVVAAAYAVGTLTVMSWFPVTRAYIKFAVAVMAIEACVGGVGFILHLLAALDGPGTLRNNFVFGTPVFAPLLFSNLAILGLLGASSDGQTRFVTIAANCRTYWIVPPVKLALCYTVPRGISMLEYRLAQLTAFATFLLLMIGAAVNPTGFQFGVPGAYFAMPRTIVSNHDGGHLVRTWPSLGRDDRRDITNLPYLGAMAAA